MNNLIRILTLLSMLSSLSAAQEQPDFECTTPGAPLTQIQLGGRFASASSNVHALVVFVQFPDDNYDVTNATWPKNQPPAYMHTFIDSLTSQNSTNGNVTHYFREMSRNQFVLTATSRFVITPHSRQWYLDNGWHRWIINKEILETLDLSMDFGQFDKWDRNGEYDINPGPDGHVDMIFMLYRNISMEYPVTPSDDSVAIVRNLLKYSIGEASLGDNYYGGPTQFYVDNSARTIGHGWPGWGQPGSGVTMINWINGPQNQGFSHEFVHHLLGGNEYHGGLGFWATLNDWGVRSNCMNAYERQRLGWITYDAVGTTTGTFDFALTDFVTTGKAIRIKIPSSNSNEYFILENHQRLSTFDVPDQTPGAKGLFVLHQYGDLGSSLRLIPPDGRWAWTVPEMITNPYGSSPATLAVFQKGAHDRVNGYHDCQRIPYVYNGQPGNEVIHFYKHPITGQTIEKALFAGDGKDAFNLGYATVFSPWSNPNSQDNTKNSTGIAFELLSVNGTTMNIRVHVNTGVNASPSKPQGLRVTNTTYNSIQLAWDANLESDISTYEVWRQELIEPRPWQLIGTTSSTTFTDYEYIWLPSGNADLEYKIRAKDTQNKLSTFSEVTFTEGEPVSRKDDEPLVFTPAIPSDFDLKQNYPNPFNPSTEISFQLPEPSFVEITVLDALGRQVLALVNRNYPAGYQRIPWNGADDHGNRLATGVYFYRMIASGQSGTQFTKVMKMALTK